MGGNAMYYDLNTLSDNMIMLDRKQARYPNGVGECYHLRPEDEYSALMRRLGDQVTNLSLSSTDLFNPLDININYSEVESLLRLKSDFVLSFYEIIIGNKTGLEAIEKTVIDWVVQKIYHSCFADIRPENMPILSNMMETLKPGTSLRLNGWLRH